MYAVLEPPLLKDNVEKLPAVPSLFVNVRDGLRLLLYTTPLLSLVMVVKPSLAILILSV